MPEPVDPAHQKIIRDHMITTVGIAVIATALLRYTTERTKLRTGKLTPKAK